MTFEQLPNILYLIPSFSKYISKLIIAFICFIGIGRFFSLIINLIGLDVQKFNYVDLAYYDTFIELVLTIIVIMILSLLWLCKHYKVLK